MENLSVHTTRSPKAASPLGIVSVDSIRKRAASRPTHRPLKIAAIFGTRPEVIKFFPVIKQLEQCPSLQSLVISTSQHREMIDELLPLFSVGLDYDLNIIQRRTRWSFSAFRRSICWTSCGWARRFFMLRK